MRDFEGKGIIVTGASRGIGRAIALAYAKEGAKLALAARTRRDLEQTAQEAQALGASTCIVPVDISATGLKRDNLVSVRYSEKLDSGQSSAILQRTDRHGILDQKSADFQRLLC